MRRGALPLPFVTSFVINSRIVTSWSPSNRGPSLYRSRFIDRELDHQHPTIGLESRARGRASFLRRLGGRNVRYSGDKASFIQTLRDKLALQVDLRIDLVCDAVVALVAIESDVMCRRAHP